MGAAGLANCYRKKTYKQDCEGLHSVFTHFSLFRILCVFIIYGRNGAPAGSA